MSLVRSAALLLLVGATLLGVDAGARGSDRRESDGASFSRCCERDTAVADTASGAGPEPGPDTIASARFAAPIPQRQLGRGVAAVRGELSGAFSAAHQIRGPPAAA